jgi:hypothetical protein
MTTLAEKRKEAIKTFTNRMAYNVKQLEEMSAAMTVLGFTATAEKVDDIVRNIKHEMAHLRQGGSVN